MPELIRVPEMDLPPGQLQLAAWLLDEGAAYGDGDALARLQIADAGIQVKADGAGILHRQLVQPGDTLHPNTPLCMLRDADETVTAEDEAALLAADTDSDAPNSNVTPPAPRGPSGGLSVSTSGVTLGAGASAAEDKTYEASPSAEARAYELGVDLSKVRGTGPGGVIRVEDVDTYFAFSTDPDRDLDG